MQPGEVVFIGDAQCYIFQMEEWEEYSKEYLRTFGEIQITAIIRSTSSQPARDITLSIDLYSKEKIILYSGQQWLCAELEPGEEYKFTVKHKFEYYQSITAKNAELSLSNI